MEQNKYDFPPSMTGLINVNEKEYDMKAGNYRWERKQGSGTQAVETDAASSYLKKIQRSLFTYGMKAVEIKKSY